MTALLNLDLDRFPEEPLEMPAIVRGPEDRKDDMFAASEGSEVSDYIARKLTYLRNEAAKRLGSPIQRYALEYGVSATTGYFTWQASLVWGLQGSYKADVAYAGNMDRAIAELLAKLPAPVDLSSILGYTEQ